MSSKTFLPALGLALAKNDRPLVYGGGSMGIMGVISDAVLEGGGKVLGVIPRAMVAAGGEDEKVRSATKVYLNEAGREKVLSDFGRGIFKEHRLLN